eukprot:UN06306
MSVQNAAAQLLQVEQSQIKLEMEIKMFQSALSRLQGDNWQTHFTQQLTTIKEQVAEMSKLLINRQKENKRLKQERDSAQKTVNDLATKLKESQKKINKDKNEDQKEEKQQHQPMVCGGAMNKDIDDNIKQITATIKDIVINKAKSDNENDTFVIFDEFTPIQAKSQVVAGINWFLKIRTSKNSFIHVKVWAKLNKEYELSAIQYNKAETDPLTPF